MNGREILQAMAASGAAALFAPPRSRARKFNPTWKPYPNRPAPLARNGLCFWLETSLKRVYATSPPGAVQVLPLVTLRNARVSFQACFRNDVVNSAIVRCDVAGADDWARRVRRVGFVPMRALNTFVPDDEIEGIGHIPGLCPDPLFPEETVRVERVTGCRRSAVAKC